MRRLFTLVAGLFVVLALGACGPPFSNYGVQPAVTPQRPFGDLPGETLARPTNIAPSGPTIPLPETPAVQVDTVIFTALQNDGRFTTLLAALEAVELDGALRAEGSSTTIFAPTDAAFAALPAGTVEQLLADPVALRDVLLYHFATGFLTPTQVGRLQTIGTLGRGSITVSGSGANLRFNQAARLDGPLIQAANGTIVAIDQVLTPPQ